MALGLATLSTIALVDLLTLIGLISKRGILIVDFANKRALDGSDLRSAVLGKRQAIMTDATNPNPVPE